MKNEKQDQIIITPENVDNVVFKDVTISKKCSVSFETPLDENGEKRSKEWRDSHPGYSESVMIKFNMNGSALSDVLEDAAARLVIKGQTRIRDEKPTPESMAEYLEAQKREIEYNYAELEGRKPFTPESQLASASKKMLEAGTISQAQYDAIMDTIKWWQN